MPVIYGTGLVIIGLLFIVAAKNKTSQVASKSMTQLLSPLKNVRVWRFGAYYFLVFGFFVAYSQWLLPNFMNVYHTSLVMGGMFATMFSLPSGVIRAFGGYLSDKFGARKVMYWVLGSSIVISFLLMFPKMEVFTAGPGVMATTNGIVTEVSANEIIVNGKSHKVSQKQSGKNNETAIFPVKNSWQEIVVKQNQEVKKKELLAQGITQIKFSANLWVYVVLVILIGISLGIGKAAVYKHIPEYFPNEVGVVGGMVGLIGGMGGFFGPIIFGYLLTATGLWTSSWIFIFVVSVLCLLWMHRTIIMAMRIKSPEFTRDIEDKK